MPDFTHTRETRLADSMNSAMRRKLHVNRHKTGWEHDSLGALMRRLREEVNELDDALVFGDGPTAEDVWNEAADVANFAAMIAQNYERLTVKES